MEHLTGASDSATMQEHHNTLEQSDQKILTHGQHSIIIIAVLPHMRILAHTRFLYIPYAYGTTFCPI